MSSAADWYVARAGGVVAYVLLSTGVVLGMSLAGRARSERWPRFAVTDVHRFVGLLAGMFIAIHVAAILLDDFLPFGLAGVAIPFAAPYRPFATALGVVSAELLLALALTNRLRGRIPHRVWRRAHYLNLPVWIAATAHGLLAGTDATTAWLLAIYVAAIAAVVSAGLWRFNRPPAARRPSSSEPIGARP